jgi:DNA-directed RNA polymerase specialized sigma24 family protein
MTGRRTEAAEVAFQDVTHEHLPRLYGLARRLAGDEAEDLVQDCLMGGFKGYDPLMRKLIPPERQHRVATSVIVRAVKS